MTNLSIAGYILNPEQSDPLRVLLTSDNDKGYVLVSGHHKAGEYFMGNITQKYNQSLGAQCERYDTADVKDGHIYTCQFKGHTCSQVKDTLGTDPLLMRIQQSNDTLHLNVDDILITSG